MNDRSRVATSSRLGKTIVAALFHIWGTRRGPGLTGSSS